MATTESLKKNNICTMPTQIEKSVKRFYKQIYRKDWEEHVIFKGRMLIVNENFKNADLSILILFFTFCRSIMN